MRDFPASMPSRREIQIIGERKQGSIAKRHAALQDEITPLYKSSVQNHRIILHRAAAFIALLLAVLHVKNGIELKGILVVAHNVLEK